MVTKVGLDRGVGVGRVAKAGHRQSKGSLLEGTNHGASGLEKSLLENVTKKACDLLTIHPRDPPLLALSSLYFDATSLNFSPASSLAKA